MIEITLIKTPINSKVNLFIRLVRDMRNDNIKIVENVGKKHC